MKHRIVVAVTGASGAIYARQLLQKLAVASDQLDAVGIIMTNNARTVWQTELEDEGYMQLPFPVYGQQDFHAPFASGSGQYDTMIICPCSMGTLGRIATGISNDLISRAADVVLKERRKLICVVRETPYNLIHIRNMQTVTEAGGIICPATPSFYSKPASIEAVVATVVDRVLDLAGIKQDTYRWGS
ncbi:UbiX family flavin prenyltransferase [Chitinophaga pendula]|uniref:UbiX family flavin prenyltransferase n=1 Tax=Chitinophaga TaxID=79328 RepID=UPI000BAE8936|nr:MULTISPECIES: UbiX family flavin prenyltransferase [Chitinophaga]ASZ11805.1 3-octaprenyl-4-hydroxybenzoate carboxy-lyase [Chitinophaga sp. MD30]UCJ05175.1 UbiX family flavin prenyltransferase [Chitinophaga pendula]